MSSGRSTSVLLSAVTPLPAAVSHTMVSPIPLTPHQLPFLPTINIESVTTTSEVDVEMVDADAVHKKARGKKKRISPKTLKYRTSFPDVEGNSHTTANPTTVLAAVSLTISSGNPPSVLVVAVTPSPAAVSPTISSESVTTDASTSEVDVEMGMQLQSTNRQEERRGVSH
ncbi:hypothetical protein GBA52_019101 [Prunus armeniaca]|nr:hypothetical protein GBA52_019101 [Prunus armeniaca]